jgi:hypothetical protein
MGFLGQDGPGFLFTGLKWYLPNNRVLYLCNVVLFSALHISLQLVEVQQALLVVCSGRHLAPGRDISKGQIHAVAVVLSLLI